MNVVICYTLQIYGSYLLGSWFADTVVPLAARSRSSLSALFYLIMGIVLAMVCSICWGLKLQELLL